MFQKKIKKIGNSLGIIIPMNTVKTMELKPEEEVYVNIYKAHDRNVFQATWDNTNKILEDLQIIKEEIRNRTN